MKWKTREIKEEELATVALLLLPPRNCTHQPFPFGQIAAKAQLAGCVETQPSVYLATLSAFCVLGVPIVAA